MNPTCLVIYYLDQDLIDIECIKYQPLSQSLNFIYTSLEEFRIGNYEDNFDIVIAQITDASVEDENE
jgi:hypothetical protein